MNDYRNPGVDAYLSVAPVRREEMLLLREIALSSGLKEEIKWGKPCYTFRGKNVVLIQGFKAYCALLFFKGYMMDDPEGILVRTGANTRKGRQIRFDGTDEIRGMAPVVKDYIRRAVALEESGK